LDFSDFSFLNKSSAIAEKMRHAPVRLYITCS